MIKNYNFSLSSELDDFKVKIANTNSSFKVDEINGYVTTVGTNASYCWMSQELPSGSKLKSIKARIQSTGFNADFGPMIWDENDGNYHIWAETYSDYKRVGCFTPGADQGNPIASFPYTAGTWVIVEMVINNSSNTLDYYLGGTKLYSTMLNSKIKSYGFGFYSDQDNSISYMDYLTVEYADAAEKALLLIELVDGLQKEYELTQTEVDSFISWYNNRAGGTGDPCYIFNKDFNIGPFDSRKDYLTFDKIQNFEVMAFTK